MAVKLRLQRKGRKKAPFYHIIAADARAPRDGRFIEKLGTYNPLTIPATIVLDRERAYDWLMKGAQPTDTVRAILRFKGVLYQKHLALGVKKGALTEEQAEAKLNNWIEEKENRIAKRREETAEKRRQYLSDVDGSPRVKAKPAPEVVEAPAETEAPAEEPAAEVVEAVEAAAEETVAAVEEAVAEEAAPEVVAEEAAAEPAEETAAAAETAEATEETPAAEEEKKED